MSFRSLSIAAALLIANFVPAQEGPKPGPEHAQLKKSAGKWDAVVEMVGMPPSKGTAEMKVAMGGFWLVEDFEADFGGMPFQGHGLHGFDQRKGKYVSTWVDSMTSEVMHMEGTYDAKTKTLTMFAESRGMTGEPVKVRNVTTEKDENTAVFEMFQTGADGKEGKVMTITYTRQGKK